MNPGFIVRKVDCSAADADALFSDLLSERDCYAWDFEQKFHVLVGEDGLAGDFYLFNLSGHEGNWGLVGPPLPSGAPWFCKFEDYDLEVDGVDTLLEEWLLAFVIARTAEIEELIRRNNRN